MKIVWTLFALRPGDRVLCDVDGKALEDRPFDETVRQKTGHGDFQYSLLLIEQFGATFYRPRLFVNAMNAMYPVAIDKAYKKRFSDALLSQVDSPGIIWPQGYCYRVRNTKAQALANALRVAGYPNVEVKDNVGN